MLSDNYGSTDKYMYIDLAYLQLGMLQAGRFTSVYDYGGGFTIDGSDYDFDSQQTRLP